jgi:microcin C transport system permease protein
MLVVATFAELISNDRPLVARYEGELFFPLFHNQPERRFGGDFATPTDWKDPFITEQFAKPGNGAFFTVNKHSANSQYYFQKLPSPSPPGGGNWLGTDADGHDMVARLIYGFRVSIWFAFALTLVGVVIGMLMGAVQGYFGGRVDLFLQRIFEIWGAVPELYPADHLRLDLRAVAAAAPDPARAPGLGLHPPEFLRNRRWSSPRRARPFNAQIIWRRTRSRR